MNKEQRADEEEKTGKHRGFDSIEALLDDLHGVPRVPIFLCPQCHVIFYPKSVTDTHCV